MSKKEMSDGIPLPLLTEKWFEQRFPKIGKIPNEDGKNRGQGIGISKQACKGDLVGSPVRGPSHRRRKTETRTLTDKITTTCASCGPALIVPSQAAGMEALCKKCRENTQFQETIGPETKNTTALDTATLGKSLAATKLIKEVLNVAPSVDLDYIPTQSLDSVPDKKTGDSGKSVREIISQAKKDTKYIIDNVIGKGGMGAVLGTIDQDIRRKVAMKVMLPENRSDTLKVIRFLEEAQVTGQLEHPNIVPVHEIGIDEKARIYFTMKLVQGENLETIIGKCDKGNQEYLKKYSLGVLLQLFMKVCDGMSYAHAKGVLHRDLKPENIMIGGFGEVLVMDWDSGEAFRKPGEEPGLVHLRLQNDRVAIALPSNLVCQTQLDSVAGHTFTIRVLADMQFSFLVDDDLICPVLDGGFRQAGGRLSFSGTGWVDYIQVSR